MATDVISRAQAKAQGLKRYFTGLPCEHGHIAERGTANGTCIECRKDIQRKWRAAHPEKVRDKLKRYWAANPEKKREKYRKYSARNPEVARARGERWRKANPDKARAKDKRWSVVNKEKIARKNKRYKTAHAHRLRPIAVERMKQWARENPERARLLRIETARRRRARKLEAVGTHTREEAETLFARQSGKCASCFCELTKKTRELDHIIALAKGGTNDIANLQWLCAPCNRAKGAKDPLEWAQENGRLL